MRYTFDCEFNEGQLTGQPKGRGKQPAPVFGVELISIGIKCQDGREYYAVNGGFNEANCNNFVLDNVLPKLPAKDTQHNFWFHPSQTHVTPDVMLPALADNRPAWRTMREIAADIEEFIRPDLDTDVRLYAYYAAYDHVALCSLWGNMISLPKGMPMYTRDLKVMAEQLGMPKELYPPQLPPELAHDALQDAKWDFELLTAIAQFQQGRL